MYVAAAFLLALQGCGSGGAAGVGNNAPVASQPRDSGSIEFTQIADHAVYRVGQQINITFQITNFIAAGPQSFTLANTFPAFATSTVAAGVATPLISPATPPPGAGVGSGGGGIAGGALTQPTGTPISVGPVMTMSQTVTVAPALPPGTYVLTSWLDGTSTADPSLAIASATTTNANPITIRVIK